MDEISIVDSFEKILDQSTPIMDTAIDLVINDESVNSIPFLSAAIAAYHIGKTIRERYHLEKLHAFIQEIANGTCDENKRKEYITSWHANKGKRAEELKYLIVIIDRYLHKDMARMMARVYLSYLEGEINWETVLRYSAIIDRLLPGDYETLKCGDIKIDHYSKAEDTILRLVGVGLMVAHESNIMWNKGMGGYIDPRDNGIEYKITNFGRKFISILS